MGRHTIAVLANDRPGVLQRIAGLFGRRGFNIGSITVGTSEEPTVSRMTIVADGDDRTRDQMVLQLLKLVDVIEAYPLSGKPMVARELMLIKLRAEPADRPEIMALAESFRCAVVDVGPCSMIIQAAGDTAKNDALLRLFKPYGVEELTRTGETSMARAL